MLFWPLSHSISHSLPHSLIPNANLGHTSLPVVSTHWWINIQSYVKIFLLNSENNPQNVPLLTPKLYYGTNFQPAIPKTWQEPFYTTLYSQFGKFKQCFTFYDSWTYVCNLPTGLFIRSANRKCWHWFQCSAHANCGAWARVRPIVIFWLLGRYLIPGISKMSNIRPKPNNT